MQENTLEAVRQHAQACYPHECCGLVIVSHGKEMYVACRNAATTPSEHFILPADEYAAAEDRGEIISIVHSHPDVSATPSEADRVACEGSGLPWLIIGWPAGDLHVMEPTGYVAPLVGRAFAHGVLDCYSLVRDWYSRERSITLLDFERKDGWWDDGASDLYMNGFGEAGFEAIESGSAPAVGDVILMQIRSKNGVPNHAAIYLGDGQILQHVYGRLASRDVYGGYWQETTRMILRYKGVA